MNLDIVLESKRTIYSLIPNLQGLTGHDYFYHQALGKASTLIGLHHTAFIPHLCSIPASTEEWCGIFHKSKGNIKSLFSRWLEFCSIFKKTRKGNRLFFLESFTTIDYIAFIFAALFFSQKKDKIWLLFRYSLDLLQTKGFIHVFLFKLLRLKLKSDLAPLTDSELIASSLQKKLKQKINVMPIPHTEAREISSEAIKHARIVCWWPGQPRKAKGLKEIQELLLLNDKNSSKVELVLSKKSIMVIPFSKY